MNTFNVFRIFKKPVVAGLAVFFVLLALTQSLAYQHYLVFKSARSREMSNAANLVKERLQTALSNSLSATQTLSFVIKKYGVPDDFDSIARRILESNRFIDALELEEGGTITHVYPIKGNESVIGYNVLADSIASIEAFKAIEKKQLFFAGPFKLKQGGYGIVGRLPIFIGDKFWGFSVALIKLSTFIHMAEMDSVGSGPYIYQLAKENPQSGKLEFFLPNPELCRDEIATPAFVPNGEWKIYVKPKKSEAPAAIIPFSLLGFILSLFGGVLALYVTRQPYGLKKLVDEKSIQLRNTEENYRITLERVSDAFVALDTNWRFTYMNVKAGEIFGCNPDKIIGKCIWTEFPDFVDTPFYKAYYMAMQLQKYIYLEEFHAPYNLWFENNIYPSANGLSVFFKDITERKKIDLALQQSEFRYRQLIQEMPEAVYTCDQEGYVMLYNKAAVRLWGVEPVTGKDKWGGAAKLYTKDGAFIERGTGPMAVALNEGKPAHGDEVIIERQDGSRRNVLSHHTLLYDSSKKIMGAVNIMVDITERRRAEEEAEAEKGYSDRIINSLPGVFYLFSREGKYLRWNRNLESVSGYNSEEISQMNPLAFFDEEDKEMIIETIGAVFTLGKAEVEADLLTKDGRKIPYFFNGYPGKFGDDECLIGMGIDISERKKAEAEIVKSEKRLRLTLDRMLEGIQLFDENWRCLYVNDAAAQQGPYSKEETFGRTLMENYPGIEDTPLFKIFEECRDKNISKHIEYNVIFPDGPTKWFELSIQPNPEGLFVLSVDIDERKKAEDAIQESEKKYRYLFNNNPAVIIIWDLEAMVVLEVNNTALQEYGYTREEFKTLSVLDYRPDEDKEKLKNFAKRMLTEPDTSSRAVWRHFKKNGELMYMDISSHRMVYNNRPAILSVAENITQKMLIEEQLKKSYDDIRLLNMHLETVREEERAFIAREIHDELGQQLTALKMDASWINKKLAVNDTQASERLNSMLLLIDETVKTVRRIASDLRPGILDDLGLIAALEWQSNEFEKRTGIKVVFNSAVNEMEIQKKCSTAVFRVYQEVLTNIARHAHATLVETQIELSGHMLRLSIKDNGIGFSIDEVKSKNTLGLIGINERVAMLHGEIILDSRLDEGTHIIITVPLSLSEND
jgi:PAS domain S-box-containing protein